ncbi:MAG: carboxymuconolactone decarboxylase family protein [Lawsonibacter sp.]|jgi:alkylhydroperoxidase/carboxymuconolactone decarboxylase family protein YurZ
MSQYNPKFLEEMKEYDPVLYAAANGVVDMAYGEGALDTKTKLLIAVALDALSGSEGGVTSLSTRARAAGATEEEVKEAIRMAYYISGMKVIKAATGAMK